MKQEEAKKWSVTINRDDRTSTIHVWAIDEEEAREKGMEHIHLLIKVVPFRAE